MPGALGFIDAYLDGEFDAVEAREVEDHLAECPACKRTTASRSHLRALLRHRCETVRPPPGLKDRILARLDDADADPGAPLPAPEDRALFGDPEPPPPPAPVPSVGARMWRSAPLLASVGVLCAFVWMTSGGFSQEDVVGDAVSKHARNLPIEVAGPNVQSLQGWARGKVDFNPRLPVFRQGLEPIGARLSHILDRPAVYLVYGEPDGGRRASLFVFADPALNLDEEPGAHRRLGAHEVRIATRKGYNVVMWKDHGIVYSLVSDMDEASLARVLESARNQ